MADGGGAPTDFSMDAGGGGAFLLNLLQRQQQSQSSSSLLPTQPLPTNSRHVDPAVAVMGPTHTMPYNLFPPPPPVDPATVLSSSPSLPFHSSSQMFLHHGNNDQQQFAPPLNYRQSFNLPDLGPNQGYQVGGINGGIKEDYNNSANLMAYDEFQRRNQQQFVPPMNLNINISTMARDFGSNQGYPVGDNGGVRDMYNANHNMRDISQSTNQQYISLLNRHQRPDLSANLGLPNGYNENLTRNQRIQDAQKLFDLMSQREREERIFQRPVHPSQQINQFPNLNNYDGINYPNRGNLNGNDNYNPTQFLNSHNSRDLGKWVNPNEKENTVALDKFEVFSKKSETGFVNTNQNNASFVASSSDTSKEEEREEDLLTEQLTESLVLDDKNALVPSKNFVRNKEYRCDFRGQNVSSQRIRIQRRTIQCRRDIDVFAPAFLTIYESLIPSNEEVTKQRNLISSLNKVIRTEWPHARLHIYGSCASNFAVSNSDIDLCLSINTELEKPEIIVKLAEILEHAKLEIMQALPRARVPIVKMMDPETGISCDICINNLLAVVNTKLLKDYSIIDPRLRQLAYIVKHWAKSRRVNETYQGTLSSYSYVIMCIYYLQNRRPAILPCLQSMEATYVAKIDDKEYRYYDKVENLRGLGARNRETISRLIWGFFQYWAYQHDYTSDVISIRTGSVISKHEKDWTRRVGNDRHLICIEDPFEITHDLGRVVDKFTIKILREEFERAANIMQYDPNPTVGLFENYIPPPKVEEDFGDEFEGLNIH